MLKKLFGKKADKKMPLLLEHDGFEQAQYSSFCATKIFAMDINENGSILWSWLEARENKDKTWSIMKLIALKSRDKEKPAFVRSEKTQDRNVSFKQVLEKLSIFEEGLKGLREYPEENHSLYNPEHHFHAIARTEGCVLDVYGNLHPTDEGRIITEGTFDPEEIEKTREAIRKRPSLLAMKTQEVQGYYQSLKNQVPETLREFTDAERLSIAEEEKNLHVLRRGVQGIFKELEISTARFNSAFKDADLLLYTGGISFYLRGKTNRSQFAQHAFEDLIQKSQYLAEKTPLLAPEREKINKFFEEAMLYLCVLSAKTVLMAFSNERNSKSPIEREEIFQKQIEKIKKYFQKEKMGTKYLNGEAILAPIKTQEDGWQIYVEHILRKDPKEEMPPSLVVFARSFDEWCQNNANRETIVYHYRQEKEKQTKEKKKKRKVLQITPRPPL